MVTITRRKKVRVEQSTHPVSVDASCPSPGEAAGDTSQTETIHLNLSQANSTFSVDIHWLIEHHHASVYRYAYRLTGNANDAEDLTQQSFLMAHQRLSQLRDPEKCLSWMLTIVRNSFFKMNRRQRPSCAANLELDVDQIQQPTVDHQAVDSERLQMAFNQMDPPQKLILMMFYFDQLSYKEIAEKLDVKIGTVMSRLSRAKSRLRGCLQAMGGVDETIDDEVDDRANGQNAKQETSASSKLKNEKE